MRACAVVLLVLTVVVLVACSSTDDTIEGQAPAAPSVKVINHSSRPLRSVTGFDLQVKALYDLYNSTNGNGWAYRGTWLQGDPCTWYGVRCNNSAITSVSLPNNNLVGTLNPSIGLMNGLVTLNLARNKIAGLFPTSLGFVYTLTSLDLSSNLLSGTFPASLGNLVSIERINLSENRLSGTLSYAAMENLVNLSYFNASYNELSGALPGSLGYKYYLDTLSLSHNKFVGTIPDTLLSYSTTIGTLQLDNNKLESPLSRFEEEPWYYTQIDLRNNAFTCPLPSWCSAPPNGDGSCAPCRPTSKQLYCCYYANGIGQKLVRCYPAVCANVADFKLVSSNETSSCNDCFA